MSEGRCWFCKTDKDVNYHGHIVNPCPWAEFKYIAILMCGKCYKNHKTDLKEYWIKQIKEQKNE